MPGTTPAGLPYMTDADPLADVATHIKNLATYVDTGPRDVTALMNAAHRQVYTTARLYVHRVGRMVTWSYHSGQGMAAGAHDVFASATANPIPAGYGLPMMKDTTGAWKAANCVVDDSTGFVMSNAGIYYVQSGAGHFGGLRLYGIAAGKVVLATLTYPSLEAAPDPAALPGVAA